MESHVLNMQLEQVVAKLREMATTKHKEEMAERVIKDIHYFVEHVDESQYGMYVVRNLMIYLGLDEKSLYRILDNAIVLNTMRHIFHEIDELKAGKPLQDPNCFARKEGILPGSKKLYRGKKSYIDACEDGQYTIHFKVGVNGSMPTVDEVFELVQRIIETAEIA